MSMVIFNEDKFIKDVLLAIREDDDSLRDSIETIIVSASLPLAFSTLGWENIPLGLIAAACSVTNLNPADYFDISVKP